jgi:hypothetical protein
MIWLEKNCFGIPPTGAASPLLSSELSVEGHSMGYIDR